MIEILCLVLLCVINGRIAIQKGLKPMKYRVFTIASWIGFEFIGVLVGLLFVADLVPGIHPFYIAMYTGLIGAAIGGMVSHMIVKRAKPDENGINFQKNQMPPTNQAYEQPMTFRLASEVEQEPKATEVLDEKATIEIHYDSSEDFKYESFYLNGREVCSLFPESSYTFTTDQIKNIFTVGESSSALCGPDKTVRFVASAGGNVKIHIINGRIDKENFQNYVK